MIKLRLSCVPHGILPEEEIAELHIINNLSHAKRPAMGNYTVKVFKNNKRVNSFEVKNHHREHGLVPLVKRVMNKLEL